MTKAWDKIEKGKGHKIAFVFPSHLPIPLEDNLREIENFRKLASILDLDIHSEESLNSSKDVREWGTTHANAPMERAKFIHAALKDKKVKVIFARGGHGADETIMELDRLIKQDPIIRDDAPPLIGFSDATQLQLYLGEQGLVSPIQVAAEGNHKVQEKLQKLLQEGEEYKQPQMPLTAINASATAHLKEDNSITGITIGGNDTAIFSAHRSDYRLQAAQDRDNILLLEGKNTYGVPKVLEMLKKQGQLDNGSIKAIILSECYGNNGYDNTIEEIEKAVKGLDILVFMGIPYGHSKFNKDGFTPIPLYTETTISVTNGKCAISFNPVRTKENVELTRAAYAAREPLQTVMAITEVLTTADLKRTPVELRQLNKVVSTAVPTQFIGGCVNGLDIPSFEGARFEDKDDLLIHISMPDNTPPDALGFWGFAQKISGPLMELKKMGNVENARSITFSAPIDFPEAVTEYMQELTEKRFPGKPVYTALIPESSDMVKSFKDIRFVESDKNPGTFEARESYKRHTVAVPVEATLARVRSPSIDSTKKIEPYINATTSQIQMEINRHGDSGIPNPQKPSIFR